MRSLILSALLVWSLSAARPGGGGSSHGGNGGGSGGGFGGNGDGFGGNDGGFGGHGGGFGGNDGGFGGNDGGFGGNDGGFGGGFGGNGGGGGFGGGGFGGGGFGGGGYGVPSNPIHCTGNQVEHEGRCVDAQVERKIFVYKAPEIQYDQGYRPAPPPPKIQYDVVFVKTPEGPEDQDPVIAPPPQKQTVVYVLHEEEQADGPQLIEFPEQAPREPEVFFVNYKDGDNPQLPIGLDLRGALAQAVRNEQGTFINEGNGGFNGGFNGGNGGGHGNGGFNGGNGGHGNGGFNGGGHDFPVQQPSASYGAP